MDNADYSREVAISEFSETDVAVVGMAARVPGARTPEEYWRNLCGGVESVRFLTDKELRDRGVPRDKMRDPAFVKAVAMLDDMQGFDAEFFGFSPRDASIMDPQHRHFLECAWEALEDAGHPPERFEGPIAVYAGCGMNSYMMFNLLSNKKLMDAVGLFLIRHTANDKDFLATRVSYELGLTGPSVSVQTACSTSLVAIHSSCQALLTGECDMALAGGVTIDLATQHGYEFREGEILSPDGHCRPFDHRAEGTLFGSGAGVVVLRRLQDAVRDGDNVYAVIKGTAINNDGSNKIGYLAPSVDGQAAVVAEALAVSGLEADAIGYVECHGTGTRVGDPIEVAALVQAYRATTDRTGFCGIGSVKSNIGHMDTAAGVASFIKVVQAVRHGQIPPSLNFEKLNPLIALEDSPFYVCDQLREWKDSPRLAGVSSLGVGGTNAHAIVEQPPELPPSSPQRRPFQLLVQSAHSRPALDASTDRLVDHLKTHETQNLADLGYTLQEGRRAFVHRRVVACADHSEGARLLAERDRQRVFTHAAPDAVPSVVFMLPGGGAVYPGMGVGLCETEPVFREHMDRGFDLLRSRVEFDLRDLLFAGDDRLDEVTAAFDRPSVQLPAIFLVEYALAKLWMSYGIEPAALIGHSMGENTVACLAGVLSFEDAVGLIVLRGQLFERVPEGGMLSVPLSAVELEPLLGDLDLALVNSPDMSVVSGAVDALDALTVKLAERDVEAKRVGIAIAAHSRLLEPILDDFGAYMRGIELHAPRIPFVSNHTGTWITDEQATDADYWVRHLRHTIHFADGISTLLEEPGRVFLEVGPGKILGSLARLHPKMDSKQSVLSSLRHADEAVPDPAFFLTCLGRLWASGVEPDWRAYYGDEIRRRVPAPTSAFQHKRHWIEPGKPVHEEAPPADVMERLPFEEWFSSPVWTATGGRRLSEVDVTVTRERWLVFIHPRGLGRGVAERLEQLNQDVVTVTAGQAYERVDHNAFFLDPGEPSDYVALVRELVIAKQIPDRILHTWAATDDEPTGIDGYRRNQQLAIISQFELVKALGNEGVMRPLRMSIVSSGAHSVKGEDAPRPEFATVVGASRVIPHEFPEIGCSAIDIDCQDGDFAGVIDRLIAELCSGSTYPSWL